jgi:uncharacterized protein with HEPN domain
MPRDFRLYLDDIIEAADKIFVYVHDMEFQNFSSDSRTVDAVVRNLEIIGEAARNLPEEIKGKSDISELEWKKITGLRNILIHEYFGVNFHVVWDIIQNKLEPLKLACEKLLEKDK